MSTVESPALRRLNIQISDEAHTELHGFAGVHGVTVSALIESLASDLDLFNPVSVVADVGVEARLHRVVSEARRVDFERRRRTGRKGER